MDNDDYGMNVVLKHRLFGIVDLYNVTKIHWGYRNRPIHDNAPRVLFESDIHNTGNTYKIADILGFEVLPATHRMGGNDVKAF